MGKKRNQAMRDTNKKLRSYKNKGAASGDRIGLGLELSFKPKKIKRDEAVLDARLNRHHNECCS